MDASPIQQRSVILAVDDDEDDVDLLRILFRKAGIEHPVEVHRRGEDLIAALTERLRKSIRMLPLICFLDVKMPVLNGHEVLEWIRKQRELDWLAVVMLSTSDHPLDVERAAICGAQCYLAKYPQPTVLRRVIEEAQRFATQRVAREWFGLSANLLLR